jgi:hypothetical protein
MIKVLADKVLAFDRGEKDREGQLVRVKTNIGFCELPDWVAQTDYFKAATADGSLKAFTSPGESEAVLKEQEKLAAIKAEVAAMEEKRDLLGSSGKGKAKDKNKSDKSDESDDKSEKEKVDIAKNTSE